MFNSENADMKYYLLNFLSRDGVYCFCESRPTGNYFPAYKMTKGLSVAEKYPEDPYSVELSLDSDYTGLKLASFIGNTGGLVILDKEVATFLENHLTLGDTERFSFTLMNEKGRVHSKDYVFFNILGSWDCLDLERSEIDADEDGYVYSIDKVVLDARKLEEAPDIIRIQEDPARVLFSQRAVDVIREQGFTNFHFKDVEITNGQG